MTYLSPAFIFIVLPLVLTIYALLPKFKKTAMLPYVGCLFYIFANIASPVSYLYFFVMVGITVFSVYLFKKTRKKIYLSICKIIAYLGLVAFLVLKFIPSVNLFHSIGIIICFMSVISMCSDILSGNIKIPSPFRDVVTYISFFPVMMSGPFIRYTDFSEKISNADFSLNNFSKGAMVSLKGAIKCLPIACVIWQAYDAIYKSAQLTMNLTVAFILASINSVAIYMFYSGYSDIGRGIALMLGIEIKNDFANPFHNVTPVYYVRNFFRSLTTFCKNYISRPIMSLIGINKSGKVFATILCGAFLTSVFCRSPHAALIVLPFACVSMYFVLYGGNVERKKNMTLNILFSVLTFVLTSIIWGVICAEDFDVMIKYANMIAKNPPFEITKYTKFALDNSKFIFVPLLSGILVYFSSKVEKYFDIEQETIKMTASKYIISILLVVAFLGSTIFLLPQFPILAYSSYGHWFL